MTEWRVIIETHPADGGAPTREAFEITPPPEPGSEGEVLRQLVTGIHPGAEDRGHAHGRSEFDDGGRRITARFEAGHAAAGARRPAQGTLFDA
jgi:hypothetical protein